MVTKVPIWLAIALKKRGKCAIRPPPWMSIGEFHLLSTCFSTETVYLKAPVRLFFNSNALSKSELG